MNGRAEQITRRLVHVVRHDLIMETLRLGDMNMKDETLAKLIIIGLVAMIVLVSYTSWLRLVKLGVW